VEISRLKHLFSAAALVFCHNSVCSLCYYGLLMLPQRMPLFEDEDDDSFDDELTVRHEFSGHEGSKVNPLFKIDLTNRKLNNSLSRIWPRLA